ncbi:hypothetical protein [Chryseobacterium sp. JUb7]|uniref:hypothetical protein n=1 Tax=Chryseobacterium sp. JUb7 TaxID=2940599 RepID=UPI0021682056|nr:hypothetical protein [Chryseobacterium sp. JUb7]MCS3531117.1 hypothetical protein [Chryseobacterium sp. JUb7]
MKKTVLFFLLFICMYSTAQEMEPCQCNLLKKYQDSIKNSYSKHTFKPISKRKTLKPPFNFITVKYLNKHANLHDIIDSVKIKTDIARSRKKPDNSFEFFDDYEIHDSIQKIEYSKKYGDIPIPLIIKTGELGGVQAILYRTKSFRSRYYLRLSTDHGKTWRNYFTGLEERDNYIFKSNSKYPLWLDKSNIQIEADIVRLIKKETFPSGEAKYETLKNNALVILNINDIIKDSDHDGINDLEEKLLLFTNPYSSDTDHDGISDFDDRNPRYKSVDNDFSKLAQGIRYGDYPLIENHNPRIDEFIVNLKTFEEDFRKQQENIQSYSSEREKSFLDTLDFLIIVTNDGNFRKIEPFDEKIVFLTSKEYSEYIKLKPDKFPFLHYSNIFKCDDDKNTYILIMDGTLIGETYFIKKILEGWHIKIGNRWQT